MSNKVAVLALVCVAIGGAIVGYRWFEASRNPYGYGAADDPSLIQFQDSVETNTEVTQDLTAIPFVDIEGKSIKLSDFRGHPVVLVVTRGYAGSICLYCSTQTSRLMANHKEFEDRKAKLIVAFPVEGAKDTNRVNEFVDAARQKMDTPVEKVPFPIVLDVELKAVDHLGIRKDLAKPATYILDEQGKVRFAYVGSTLKDRPSVKAILDQLDTMASPEKRRS